MTALAEVLKLPVGFRFRPTEVELVSYYLQNKIGGVDSHANLIIADIDILRHEPWDLPKYSLIESIDDEWFFFSRPEYMPSKRNQNKRSTNEGFWKITAKEQVIKARGGRELGKKRILTFHRGRNRRSEITNWVIHEYYIPPTNPTAQQRDIVLCRLIKKPGKKTGAATCDEGGPSFNASDVENELQLAHAMDIQMQEYQDHFEREGECMLASSRSNAGLQSGFRDNEPLESATWNQLYPESSRTVHIEDSTRARAFRVADTEALSAQVKISSGPSGRDRDVMIEEQAHKQIMLPERGHEQFDIVVFEGAPTSQINSVHVAFDEYYTNERGSRTGYPLSSTREAGKLPEKPEKPKEPERPKPRPAVDLPKESITKVNKDKKVTQGKGSSFISWETIPLTSPRSVYLFNAVVGATVFMVFALVLYGKWC